MIVPGPRNLIQLAERSYHGAEQVLALAPRIVGLINQSANLLTRVEALVAHIEDTDRRAGRVVESAEGVVRQAAGLTERLTPILDRLEPVLDKLTPILTRLADTTSPEEVSAVVSLVNDLPQIVAKLDRDILPVLDTLGTVAPDLRDLLDMSKELNEMLGALPGLGRVKRHIEQEGGLQSNAASYRADQEPPSSPKRGPRT